jgi:hypothetical protein
VPAAPITAPINLSEAALDLASGDYGDLDAQEILLEFAPVLQAPYVLAGIGLAMGILCGLTFARLVQERLDGWKQDRLALLPLGPTPASSSASPCSSAAACRCSASRPGRRCW